jgi:hypothetical protein
MADTTTSQLYDGRRNVQLKYTIFSDGTGQTGVKIIDVTTLNPNPGVHMKIRRLRYSIEGMYVRLQWDASTPIDIAVLGAGTNILDFSDEYAGGWPNNAGAGVTGSILLTTTGSLAGSNATLVIEAIKGV